eukprot:gnl/Hemi2/23492_TR7868_c0_g1_i1.p1 gnl/Hemi2/23492_TR7868_c0_g1~~gnl/Hemi2/23492_TR7868_c0_g1_i1.p1  ORF type:complete len:284 (+),score=112.12 gnl/Hemi2/23492_TR7868_c0_g1_i1:91-942(+)
MSKKAKKAQKHAVKKMANWYKPRPEFGELDTAQGLLEIPAIYIKPKVLGALVQAFTGCEMQKKYKVFSANKEGKKEYKLFAADEQSGGCVGCCARQYCKAHRPWQIKVATKEGTEMYWLDRPCNCFCMAEHPPWCSGLCCAAQIDVYSGGGSSNPRQLIGRVKERCGCCCHPTYSVEDTAGNDLFWIGGDCFVGCCAPCRSFTFKIRDQKGTENHVGELTKHQAGVMELIADVAEFSVTFPGHADARGRALLFAACYMVDFMHFEMEHDQGGTMGMGDGMSMG